MSGYYTFEKVCDFTLCLPNFEDTHWLQPKSQILFADLTIFQGLAPPTFLVLSHILHPPSYACPSQTSFFSMDTLSLITTLSFGSQDSPFLPISKLFVLFEALLESPSSLKPVFKLEVTFAHISAPIGPYRFFS